MKFCCLILGCLLTSQKIFCQSDLDAATAIRQLKDGVLLVRLTSGDSRIRALQQAGRSRQAEAVRQQVADQNRIILQAFRQEFTFCPVWFFYGESITRLQQGEQSGFFLNDSLQPDNKLHLNDRFFLIAALGRAVHYESADRRQEPPPQPGLFGESLVVYDRQMRQLRPPFPYAAREDFLSYLLGDDWPKKVRSLDRRFKAYYQSVLLSGGN